MVTTCVCAAHISNALRAEEMPHGWFSHVVVDEAGEATEPETLVPLSLLRHVAGVTIVLGDHFQLGPLVLSLLAEQLGSLGTSMLERVVNDRFDTVRRAEAVEAKDCDTADLTRDALTACEDHGLFFLTESFRSHEAIMSLYSQIFYAGQLEHRRRPRHTALLPFFEAKGVSVPIIFHNAVGKEMQDPDSTSLYNLDEVRIVQSYILELLGDKSLQLKPSDIGVITPYTKQLKALERQFDSVGSLAGIQCGTVERFQGQEKTFIIMSTVRSTRSANGIISARRHIGFVGNPKRLNVAISRAEAGLVIVGDLRSLAAHSSHWRSLVQRGQELGCILGESMDVHPSSKRQDSPLASAMNLNSAARSPVPTARASAAWNALTDE